MKMTQQKWDAMSRAEREKARDNSQLIPELIGHEGHRMVGIIREGWEWNNLQAGDKKHFTVGKSTGWVPIHLSIHSARSTGGGSLSLKGFTAVHCKTCNTKVI
jgi:hypothetical protein